MAGLVQLLGEKVGGKDGATKNVQDLANEGNVVALYFSAHWCPPCRAFTPQLAAWYDKFKKTENGDKFEIIFVSSDRDSGSFKEYYKEMPWLALPYENRDTKEKLSRKFRVSGIPTLIFLDAGTGKSITSDGRSVVAEDPEGKDFPWTPASFLDIVSKSTFAADTSGKEIEWENITAEHLGIYFSAHWCGPCVSFTPSLVETYKKINKDEKKFEIIFVSSDRDEESWKEYFSEMPWLALKFGDATKKKLSGLYDVSGIPTLVILKRATGELITANGRGSVSSDPNGEDFPWNPKPVEELTGFSASAINEQPALIWLTDESKERSKEAADTLLPIATKYLEESKAESTESKLAFFYSGPNSGDLGDSVRGFLQLPDKTPILFLTNIPEQGKFICEADKITSEVVQELVDNFKKESIKWQKLR